MAYLGREAAKAPIVTADLPNDGVTLAKMTGGTDGQIITYDASGDPVAVGPGTNGQVLTSTGAGSPPAFAAGGVDAADIGAGVLPSDVTGGSVGGLKSMQKFETAGTFTGGSGWQRPSGITTIKVYVTGGGGGGMGQASGTKQSGAAGGTAIKIIDVTSITAIDFTVGSGGAGGILGTGTEDGTQGVTSSFGTHCSASGGEGSTLWSAALGGVGIDGDLNLHGQGSYFDVGANGTCAGGNSFWGGGARGAEDTNSSVAYHGGGGGGIDQNTATTGGAGLIVVEEYS